MDQMRNNRARDGGAPGEAPAPIDLTLALVTSHPLLAHEKRNAAIAAMINNWFRVPARLLSGK